MWEVSLSPGYDMGGILVDSKCLGLTKTIFVNWVLFRQQNVPPGID